MATLAAAPQESTRAKEILEDLRRKRELLVSSNPSLQKLQGEKQQKKKSSSQRQNFKPPTVPRKHKKNKTRSSSKKNDRGAQEIRGDMKQQRDSLTAVLESYKTPGSPSRRSARSTGLSTAPTAASTRSWISSIADDDSFCYSETSLEDSPKESSIEFIIDTEESDLCSLSTKEEVQQAVDQIYKEVVPKALYAIQKETRATTFSPDIASSWMFRSQSSARDLYREESVKISVSEKKTEKKKRRVMISEQRDCVYERSSSTRSDLSFASSTASSIDVRHVRKQRSLLEDIMESVSDLKETTPAPAPVKKKKKRRSSRRPRQDDSSEGSAPILTKTSSGSGSLAPIDERKMDFDLSLFEKKGRKKKKKNTDSSIASHYVLETKRRGKKSKKVVVKPSELYVAPIPDPENMLSWDGSADGSLLVSPEPSVDQELLVSPEETKPEEEALKDASSARRESVAVSKCEELQAPVDQPEERKAEAKVTLSDREERVREIPQVITTPSLDLHSEVSELHVFQDSKSKDTDDIISPIMSRQLNSALARASEFNPVVIPLSSQEPTPEEPRAEYIPREYMKAKTEFTMEDIVREMNIISEKIGKNGLQIPPGTVLTLRRNSSEPVDLDAESASGWTFSEPSDVSSCSYTLPSRHASRRASRFAPDEGSDEIPEQLARKKTEVDITERFCGGLYHMAVLSGMPLCENEI